MSRFVAIDFETADARPESACAVGLVRVVDGQVEDRVLRLIRPPLSRFGNSRIHGITQLDVVDAPTLDHVLRDIVPYMEGAQFLVAHYVAFELRVLHALSCRTGFRFPALPVVCSWLLARDLLGPDLADLASASRCLGISLDHHNPVADAEASAMIALAALRAGIPVGPVSLCR